MLLQSELYFKEDDSGSPDLIFFAVFNTQPHQIRQNFILYLLHKRRKRDEYTYVTSSTMKSNWNKEARNSVRFQTSEDLEFCRARHITYL